MVLPPGNVVLKIDAAYNDFNRLPNSDAPSPGSSAAPAAPRPGGAKRRAAFSSRPT
jgi:hypothetical protein